MTSTQNTIKEESLNEKKIIFSEKETLHELQLLFHNLILLGTIVHLNTKEKMMNTLNNLGNKEWTTEYILKLATDNKIKWVQGSDDPIPYDTYKKQMNTRLAQILSE